MKNKKGIARIYRALGNSLSGLKFALKNEAAFRQDCILLCLVFFSLCFIDVSKLEFLALVFAAAILLITELLNSAIEAAVDLTTSKICPLAKAAKDVASAAVFVALALLFVVYIFLLVF